KSVKTTWRPCEKRERNSRCPNRSTVEPRKHETRNPKIETNLNDQKTLGSKRGVFRFWISIFGLWFELVLDFEFRISDFESRLLGALARVYLRVPELQSRSVDS